uniref:Rad60/SUMO-like domain-containing protein n=1 Tax=Panagrolaimus sp. JU765 TaxID=591449 RepID=A0AC34QK26_9BILA
MSSSDSEDDVYNFANLQKKTKKRIRSVAKTAKVIVKKPKVEQEEEDEWKKCINFSESEEEETLESLIKKSALKAKEKQQNTPEIVLSDIEEKIKAPKKKKPKVKARKINLEAINMFKELDRELKEQEAKSKKLAMEKIEEYDKKIEEESRIANEEINKKMEALKKQYRREFLNEKEEEVKVLTNRVFITLKVQGCDDFTREFELERNEQFVEKVYMKYAAEAGFDNPESFIVYWDQGQKFKFIYFHYTPESVGMPSDTPIALFITPKSGVVREVRKPNQIKLKFNLETQKEPVGILIDKDMTFGEFIKTFATQQKLDPNNIHFVFDASRVDNDETPNTLDMEDFDVVDVITSK